MTARRRGACTAVGVVLACMLPLAARADRDERADAAALRRGEQVYERCVACHAIEVDRTGPRHCGLFGRRAGTAPGYDGYSKAMRDARIVWDARSLDRFLQAPTEVVPGTSMGYAGVKDPQERADLIAWLRQASQPGKTCAVRR